MKKMPYREKWAVIFDRFCDFFFSFVAVSPSSTNHDAAFDVRMVDDGVGLTIHSLYKHIGEDIVAVGKKKCWIDERGILVHINIPKDSIFWHR